MGSESRLRRRHREAVERTYPSALVVGQPANAFTGRGRPDFYILVAGRFVAPELKTSTGRATAVQLARIRKIREAGGWSDVVHTPEQTLALITHALEGGSVWDNLFEDDPPGQANMERAFGVEDIKAFREPEVQAHVDMNGAVPAGDGVMQEPPADYPYAEIIRRLDRIESLVLLVMRESGIDPPEDRPKQGSAAEEEPSTPPKRTRRARRQ